MIGDCIASLLRSDYPSFEIVIVDNTDDGGIVRQTPAAERIRVIREERPGLSRARNTGLRRAEHDIVAFIDDDVRVAVGWLRAIAAAFEDESIDAVTGLVAPLELDTGAQREFEWYGGMGRGGVRRLIQRSAMSDWQTIRTQAVGVGANMAFRRRVFDRVGEFDEALGAGTLTLGAEDLDFFHRVLGAGLTICYEPAALVQHRHRRSVPELRAQIFANGVSYGVYLLKVWSERTVPRGSVLTFAISWVTGRVATALFRVVARPGIRCRLAWDEVRGLIQAPAAYRRAYRAGRRVQARG
jgi:GT2 family glycosyltransferase